MQPIQAATPPGRVQILYQLGGHEPLLFEVVTGDGDATARAGRRPTLAELLGTAVSFRGAAGAILTLKS
jgi:hypothetical protein